MALRLMIYDRTNRGLPGLATVWGAGAVLFRGLGRIDAFYGAADWGAALDWVLGYEPSESIAQIQFWGHGKWGTVNIDSVPLNAGALLPGHEHHQRLCGIRERLDLDALWWFRTCETFGAERGHDFARRWSEFFGRRVAGHTYFIGYWQSGLHTLSPGGKPEWTTDEGLAVGTPQAPRKAKRSRPRAPNTISCFRRTIPPGY